MNQTEDTPLAKRQKNRNTVGISLMTSRDTEAIVEATRASYPDAKIEFRDCFYKIERDGELRWSMVDVGERVGRSYDTDLFLVNMSTSYGRIMVEDGAIVISSQIAPERFRE